MTDVRKLSLASLAVSVTAATLLSVSGVAFGDPPPASCAWGSACGLAELIPGSAEGWVAEGVGYCTQSPSDGTTCGCYGSVEGVEDWVEPLTGQHFLRPWTDWMFVPWDTQCWNN